MARIHRHPPRPSAPGKPRSTRPTGEMFSCAEFEPGRVELHARRVGNAQEDSRGRGPAIHHHDVAQSSKVRWRAVKLPSRPDFQNAVRREGGPHKTPPASRNPE